MLTIRPARLADQTALLPIHLATCSADVSPDGAPDPGEPLLEPGTLRDVLVAEQDGAVGGYVRLHQPGVSLRVLAPNARARRLYEGCGFEVEGVLRHEFLLRGEYVDDLVMARHLDDGPGCFADGGGGRG